MNFVVYLWTNLATKDDGIFSSTRNKYAYIMVLSLPCHLLESRKYSLLIPLSYKTTNAERNTNPFPFHGHKEDNSFLAFIDTSYYTKFLTPYIFVKSINQ